MTRKQAEKYADAIRQAASRGAWNNAGHLETTTVTAMELATALKKPTQAVESAIAESGAAIWGCLPMGWSFSRRGATALTVSRPNRSAQEN